MSSRGRTSGADGVVEYYAARAEVYDLTAGYLDPATESLRAPIKARFQEQLRDRDVLEIACGTGYWTEAICKTTHSVVATDINPGMIAKAAVRLSHASNVRLVTSDAYALTEVAGRFSAAFAAWWWSHMPRARIPEFLTALHGKLLPGALVVFTDLLPGAYEARGRRRNADGDLIECRTLPDGRTFDIIKNFPSEQEIVDVLGERATDIRYQAFAQEYNWCLTYELRP